MKIAIVGAGIGGLAAALALEQAGFAVEVYERAPALVDQGAGITMAPNATGVLFHLGLESALLSTAANPAATASRRLRPSGRNAQIAIILATRRKGQIRPKGAFR